MSAQSATKTSENEVMPSTQAKEQVSPFKNKSYLAHWIGTSISGLGDFFTLIAMPWLVLSFTNDGKILGIVLALEAVPRAAFMLIGGVITDRFSAKKILLISHSLFMLTLILLSMLLLNDSFELWMLYGFALSLGLISALSIPPSQAILPQIIDKAQLPAGNAGLMSTRQIIKIIAPILAGLIIWGVADTNANDTQPDRSGLALAFLFDACTFAIAIITLWFVRPTAITGEQPQGSVWSLLKAGFNYLYQDKGVVTITFYLSFITFFAVGPLTTTIPLFADQRLNDGALDYGLLFTINGIGSLFGFILGAKIKQPKPLHLGLLVFSVDLLAGLSLFLFGTTNSLWGAAPFLIAIGLCNGISVVIAISWIQQRIAPHMMGRAMSLIMFSLMGLSPISMAVSGFLVDQWSLTTVICGAGIAIMSVAVVGLLHPNIRSFAAKPAPAHNDNS